MKGKPWHCQLTRSADLTVCLCDLITMVPKRFTAKYKNTNLNSKGMRSAKVNLHRDELKESCYPKCSTQV